MIASIDGGQSAGDSVHFGTSSKGLNGRAYHCVSLRIVRSYRQVRTVIHLAKVSVMLLLFTSGQWPSLDLRVDKGSSRERVVQVDCGGENLTASRI